MKLPLLLLASLVLSTVAFLKTNTETDHKDTLYKLKKKTDKVEIKAEKKTEKTEKTEKTVAKTETQVINSHKYFYANPEMIFHNEQKTKSYSFADKSAILDKIEMQKGLAAADIGF